MERTLTVTDDSQTAPQGTSRGDRAATQTATTQTAVTEKKGHIQSLRETWPLAWSDLGLFVLAFAIITAVFCAIGFAVTGPLDSSIGDADERIASDMVDTRTPRLDDVSLIGSYFAETITKVVLSAVLVLIMLWVWRRWKEALIVALALILEASCFLAVTLIVSRDRPNVPRLDDSPVSSSFPSGHTAAAVVYGALAIVVFWHTARVLYRSLSVLVVAAVAVTVGWARMYRGMHHLSDVLAGVLLGVVCLVVTWAILRHAERRRQDRAAVAVAGASAPGALAPAARPQGVPAS